MQYQNKHTGAIKTLDHQEQVSNPPVTVYVFTDGDRWIEKQFHECWKKIEVENGSPQGEGFNPICGQ
jgi:hypothetical protein